ncbi:MAG: hypothetical protein CMH53_04240 [Myxococcales bacterium]|nr:hypothetical protein [Myxococcales bacterium]|tara:strand:- start:743 stop:1024 length:282 start_codon:yes stop_codon:yes gene_type:complete
MNEQQQKAAQALFETYDQRVQDTSLTVEAAWSNKLAGEAVIKRQGLLQASDWTQLPDVPVDKPAWATYRQALRDITEQQDYPLLIDWPEAPSA